MRAPGSFAAVLLLLPLGVAAQDLPIVIPGAAPKCQFEPGAIRDTTEFSLFLTPPPSVSQARKQQDAYTPYISAIASTFQQPERISISYYPGEPGSSRECNAWCMVGPLEGEVQFRLVQGQVSDISWRLVPDSREVMRAVEQAIQASDSLRLFPELPKLKGLPKGTVRLALRLAPWPPATGGTIIGRVPLPVIDDGEPVGIISQPAPVYPSVPQEFVRPGVVQLQYVVGENGLVPEETIRVLEAEHHFLIRPAMQAILRSRFRPAMAGGCPVRQMVHQRVVFRTQ